jgi:cellulose synthase/poly-beta-1,6-N-acetylglucosamine synthase-like glycosyltransferase/peptidoglycan/xylan/chitin deacetylase (PgdA/CDA1 family)/spore germination protein YaaH
MKNDSPHFIFHEPSGQRWRRLRRSGLIAGIVLGFATALIVASVLISPQLPAVNVASVVDLPHLMRARPVPRYVTTQASTLADVRVEALTDRPTPTRLVFGYYVNWDSASMVSLRLNAHALTHVVPQWFTLRNAQGDIDDEADPAVMRFAAERRLPIIAMVHNFRKGWQTDDLHRLLNDERARHNLVEAIRSNLLEHRFAGVNIDFEGLGVNDREPMVLLIRELAVRLHGLGLLVTQSAPVDDPAYDLVKLAALNDYLLLMVYDEHYQTGPPGPIASARWFDAQLARVARSLPLEKVVIGVGNYGYDWVPGRKSASPVTFADVMTLARSYHAPVVWDDTSGNPFLQYRLGSERHHVWFLDAVTAVNEARSIIASRVRGVALWRLGAEDPAVWSVLAPDAVEPDRTDPRQLRKIDGQGIVLRDGDGEVLHIAQTPHDGARHVSRAAGGEFTERYDQYPAYFRIHSSGHTADKLIVLTFDDGPDAAYTAQILDILKARHVQATFFVVGVRAEQHPELLARMYAEGHEIGNHTYSHANVAHTWPQRTALELNATQRIIQRATGVSTTLFRPPYHADSEPQTPEELEPIARAQRLGYVTVAERIDARDWVEGATADRILAEVLTELEDGGHIVLLHDGGGDRSATVGVLPQIIDALRARGYDFGPVSELLGKTRDEVMPRHAAGEWRWAMIGGAAFSLKGRFTSWGGVLFMATLGLVLVRLATYGTLAVWHERAAQRRQFRPGCVPPVSVLIPAHNEESGIAETVRSVLANHHATFEVIVVDDGSTDDTYGLLQRTFGADRRVRLYRQSKAGKVAALTRALGLARYDIVVAIDADTRLGPHTIYTLVRHFDDAQVGAVSGNARVGNHGPWITRFQSIEYICAFNLERRAHDVLNAITVVPGAVGAWRRDLILQAGGFTQETLAEDTDLTLAIRRLGYRIRYDAAAVAYTEVPVTTAALARQRFRWLFGTLQSAWKHRDALFRPRYGSLAFVALPSIWLFQLLLPLSSLVVDLALLTALLAGNWPIVIVYGVLLLAVELVGAGLAYALERERPGDLILLFVQRLYYRQLLLYVTLQALVTALQGRRVDWHKVDRCPAWYLRPSADGSAVSELVGSTVRKGLANRAP